MITTIIPYDGFYRVFADGEMIGEESSLTDAQWLASNARDAANHENAMHAFWLHPDPVPAQGFDYLEDPHAVGFWSLMTGGRKRVIGATS